MASTCCRGTVTYCALPCPPQHRLKAVLNTFSAFCLDCYLHDLCWLDIRRGQGGNLDGFELAGLCAQGYQYWYTAEPNDNARLVCRLWQGQQVEDAGCFSGQRGGALQTFRRMRGLQPPGTFLCRPIGTKTAEGEASLHSEVLHAWINA